MSEQKHILSRRKGKKWGKEQGRGERRAWGRRASK